MPPCPLALPRKTCYTAGMRTLIIRGALRRSTVSFLSSPACGIASATLAAALLLAPLAAQAAPQAQNAQSAVA
ncbi:hypothetical protein FVW20_07815, partial [Desulfovibrio oxamicus]|nr:hypothetical protein [Nitratidesulfovibrio oxamicus]